MTKVLYYPSPISKLGMWRDLCAAAGVEGRSIGFIYAQPFEAENDRRAARQRLEARFEQRRIAGEPVPAAAERERMVRRLAQRLHRVRRMAEGALRGGATHLAIWNGQGGHRRLLVEAARAAGLKGLFAELAPIAGRITLDPQGVNAAGSLPADPDYYRAWGAAHPDRDGLVRWRELLVTRGGIRRDNQGDATALDGRPFVFVPLQVRRDTQIRAHGGWIRSVPEFIDEVARAAHLLPPGWRVVFREHPSCRQGNAEQLGRLVGDRVAVDNATDTFELVRRSQGVVTVNSSVGLQSLLLGKPVAVLGRANYAIPSVVQPATGRDALGEIFATARDWPVDEALRDAFLSFLAEEYYVTWPVANGAGRHRLSQQVRTRLAGRLTDWQPPG